AAPSFRVPASVGPAQTPGPGGEREARAAIMCEARPEPAAPGASQAPRNWRKRPTLGGAREPRVDIRLRARPVREREEAEAAKRGGRVYPRVPQDRGGHTDQQPGCYPGAGRIVRVAWCS